MAFNLDQQFFKEYKLLAEEEVSNLRVPLKPCLAVFKNINSIESCTITIDLVESKLVFDVACKYGIKRIYKLFLEDCPILQALYNRSFSSRLIFKPGPLLEALQNNFNPALEEITMGVSRNFVKVSSFIDESRCN